MGGSTAKLRTSPGVGRGQGRSHVIRLAAEGADIVGIGLAGRPGICQPIGEVSPP